MITDHMFLPGEPMSDTCYFLPRNGEEFCRAPEKDHLIDGEGTVRPHPFHMPDLAGEGGSVVTNSQCALRVCGALRLAKVHEGFKPVYITEGPLKEIITVHPSGKTEVKAVPPRMIFSRGPVQAIDLNPAVQAWDAYAAQVRDLIVRKSEGYGQAWREQGYMGNLARVLSKGARLKNMMWRENSYTDATNESESVMDTLHDLGALCAFLVANIEEGNRWGR